MQAQAQQAASSDRAADHGGVSRGSVGNARSVEGRVHSDVQMRASDRRARLDGWEIQLPSDSAPTSRTTLLGAGSAWRSWQRFGLRSSTKNRDDHSTHWPPGIQGGRCVATLCLPPDDPRGLQHTECGCSLGSARSLCTSRVDLEGSSAGSGRLALVPGRQPNVRPPDNRDSKG